MARRFVCQSSLPPAVAALWQGRGSPDHGWPRCEPHAPHTSLHPQSASALPMPHRSSAVGTSVFAGVWFHSTDLCFFRVGLSLAHMYKLIPHIALWVRYGSMIPRPQSTHSAALQTPSAPQQRRTTPPTASLPPPPPSCVTAPSCGAHNGHLTSRLQEEALLHATTPRTSADNCAPRRRLALDAASSSSRPGPGRTHTYSGSKQQAWTLRGPGRPDCGGCAAGQPTRGGA